MVIVCTDHGHFLGEKDIWGKPGCPIYEPLGHTPLFVRAPGIEAGTRDALSTNVDIHATLCDVFGVTPQHRVHGGPERAGPFAVDQAYLPQTLRLTGREVFRDEASGLRRLKRVQVQLARDRDAQGWGFFRLPRHSCLFVV